MNAIEQLQNDITGRLQSVAYFEDIAVAAPRLFRDGDRIQTPKTINDKIDRALTGLLTTSGKIGAAIRVLQPVFNVPKPNLPGPQGRLTVPIRCQVHPVMNYASTGTQKDVTSIALEVVRALHGFIVQGPNWRLHCDGDSIVPYFDEQSQLMTAEALVHTVCQLQPITSVALPTITLDALTCTLACATSGAEIYYTLDGETFPRSGETDAELYTAPFAVESGDIIRAAAYKTGLHGSGVAYQTV